MSNEGDTPQLAAPTPEPGGVPDSGALGDTGQSVLDALDRAVAVLDPHGVVVATNIAWEERCAEGQQPYGAWVDAYPGMQYVAALESADATSPSAAEAATGIAAALSGRLAQFSLEYDGPAAAEQRRYALRAVALPGGRGGVLVMHDDITWRIALQTQASQRATHDALTGLPNRILLDDRLGGALVRAQRSGGLVAVMFVDVDHFKSINDTLGHSAGDQVLVAVARRLQRACRTSDTVTRFGGDEFVLVIENVDSIANVHRVAHRVLDSMTAAVVVDGTELYFSASAGVAVTEGESVATPELVEGLIRDADTAMYRAKEAGRNTFVVFDPTMRERVTTRLAMTTSLRRAVEHHELHMLYQPQFSCDDDRLVGAEALLRWHHPERGVVPPGEFIQVAEDSGVIVEIGAWALDDVCRQAAEWKPLAPSGFRVFVNLSSRQLADPNAVALVRQSLARYQLDPQSLGIEINEAALIDDPEAAARTLHELVALGIDVAIDNFGTGYSSLASLQRFPVTTLKIDRSFVSRLPEDRTSQSLVRGIVGLGVALGLDVVAEGVETEHQRRYASDLGCHRYQGFLRARPGSPAVVTGLLESSGRGRPTPEAE